MNKEYNADSYLRYLDSKENGGTGSYTALNKGSGAYGRYQIIPKTAKYYAKKLKIPLNQWKTPANQDKMFKAITSANIKNLKENGIPVNDNTVYGTHQQGASGFRKLWHNKMENPARRKNILSNLTDKEQAALAGATDDQVRNAWFNKYMGSDNTISGAPGLPASGQPYIQSQTILAQQIQQARELEAAKQAKQAAMMNSLNTTNTGLRGLKQPMPNTVVAPAPVQGATGLGGFGNGFGRFKGEEVAEDVNGIPAAILGTMVGTEGGTAVDNNGWQYGGSL